MLRLRPRTRARTRTRPRTLTLPGLYWLTNNVVTTVTTLGIRATVSTVTLTLIANPKPTLIPNPKPTLVPNPKPNP